MGANSVLGLLFQISADPSKAQEVLAQFEKSTGTSLNQVVNHTEEMNKSLLGSHESVRLLTEEFGVHLPRAVTGAIGEMLPQFGSLGTALLGAFAIERVTEWGKEAYEVVKDLQSGVTAAVTDIGKAAEAAAKHAHDQMAQIYSDFKTTAEGQLPMEEVDAQTAKLTKYYGAFLDLQKAENAMQRPSAETMKVVSQAVAEGLTNIEDVHSKLNAMAALQSEQHKRYAELMQHESKAACDAAAKNLAVVAKATGDADKAFWQYQSDWMKVFQDWDLTMIKLQNDAMLQAGLVNKLIEVDEKYTAVQRQQLEVARQIMIAGEQGLPLQRQSTEGLQILGTATADFTEKTKHLNFALREELMLMQALGVAAQHEAKATKDDLLAGAGNASAALASLIGGQRAAAAVNAAFDFAKGAEQIAEGLNPLDPNHAAHFISAAQFFIAGAEFAKIAGTGSHHHGGGGGGGGSYSGSRGGYSRGGGDGSSRDQIPPQTLATGAQNGRYSSPGSGVIVVHGSTDLHQWVAGLVNGAVDRGINVTATSSQRGAMVGH